MGKNDNLIKMKLTPQEALIIENIRAMASQNDVVKTDVQIGDELMQKYMDMDDSQFMTYFRQCFGDETVIDGISGSMTIEAMMEHVTQWIDAEQADELFNQYVPEDVMNDIFIEINGKEDLVIRLVDMIVDGDWNHENQ